MDRIRYDKSPFDVQTDQELWDLVYQNKGAVAGERTLNYIVYSSNIEAQTGVTLTATLRQHCLCKCVGCMTAKEGYVNVNNAVCTSA